MCCAGAQEFAECADVVEERRHYAGRTSRPGPGFHFRGICYGRSKQWPKAEADLKALELFPDQPHVLNYPRLFLGRQGHESGRGHAHDARAVEQRADDGYIVDSLG